MPSFSKKSQSKLNTCHKDLQRLFNEVVKNYDCTILEGYRDQKRQDEMYNTNRSKVKWPNGKHNKIPSQAVDVAPWPIPDKWGEDNFKEKAKFYYFAGYVQGMAESMGINIRWGGDWDDDKDFDDQTFDDLVHFELML